MTQDGLIYQGIAEWEKKAFASLSPSARIEYLADIKNKASELKIQKDKILVRQSNELKIWRFNSDLAQLSWRMKYLQALNSSL